MMYLQKYLKHTHKLWFSQKKIERYVTTKKLIITIRLIQANPIMVEEFFSVVSLVVVVIGVVVVGVVIVTVPSGRSGGVSPDTKKFKCNKSIFPTSNFKYIHNKVIIQVVSLF